MKYEVIKLKSFQFALDLSAKTIIFTGALPLGGPGGHALPPTSISEPNKVQPFQFQISHILLFTGAQKLYGSETSRFLPCMLQCLDNLRQLFIFSN